MSTRITPDTTAPAATTTAPAATTTAPAPDPITTARDAIVAACESNRGNGEKATDAIRAAATDAIRTVRVADRLALVAALAAVPAVAPRLAMLAPMLSGPDAVPFGRDPRVAIRDALADYAATFSAVLAECERRGVAVPATMADLPGDLISPETRAAAAALVERWARGTRSTDGTRTRVDRNRRIGELPNGTRLMLTYRGATFHAVTDAAAESVAVTDAAGASVGTFTDMSAAARAAVTASGKFSGASVSCNGWRDWRVAATRVTAGETVDALRAASGD